MEKKEYVSPEMEIVEITEQGSLLLETSTPDGGYDPNPWE